MEIEVINNVYDVAEAKELVLGLIDSKIKFLNQKRFSQYERKGSWDDKLEERLVSLKKEKENVLGFFDSNDPKFLNSSLEVKSNIKIEIK
jgi:hypothetical protein